MAVLCVVSFTWRLFCYRLVNGCTGKPVSKSKGSYPNNDNQEENEVSET